MLGVRLVFLKLYLSDSVRYASVPISHDDLASFAIPGSVLAAAQNEGEAECMFMCDPILSF